MHIKLAESVRSSSVVSLGTTSSDPQGDDDLQKVIGYLRRSKEIVSFLSAGTAGTCLFFE